MSNFLRIEITWFTGIIMICSWFDVQIFLLQAAIRGSLKILHWLLDKGADPNAKDSK